MSNSSTYYEFACIQFPSKDSSGSSEVAGNSYSLGNVAIFSISFPANPSPPHPIMPLRENRGPTWVGGLVLPGKGVQIVAMIVGGGGCNIMAEEGVVLQVAKSFRSARNQYIWYNMKVLGGGVVLVGGLGRVVYVGMVGDDPWYIESEW